MENNNNLTVTIKALFDKSNMGDFKSEVTKAIEDAAKSVKAIEILADTQPARASMQKLVSYIRGINNEKVYNTLDIYANTKSAEKSIEDLQSKLNSLKVNFDTSKLGNQINVALRDLNKDDSLKKAKVGVDAPSLLREINKAIVSINGDSSLKKLKLGVDTNYLQQQLNKSLRSLDTTIKLKTKLETTSKTTDTKGTVTTNKTSKGDADTYQSLFSKRASAIQELDRAYQEFGRGSKEVSAALREFAAASKDVRQFGRDTGVLSLNKVKSDIERQLGAGLTTDFTKNWLRMEYDKVLRDIDTLNRQLKPEKYEKAEDNARVKAYNEEYKIRKALAAEEDRANKAAEKAYKERERVLNEELKIRLALGKKGLSGGLSVEEVKNIKEANQATTALSSQFARLRGEALKAGNALNQATNPKDVERLRAEFQKAIQALVNYQRATRGLTKGGEAQLVEKLAVGNIKEQTEAYKVLVEWIKKAVQAQRDLDVTTGRKLPRRSKDTDFMSYLNNMDWGRAVSGMAYAARGELNTVQALGNFISSMSQLSGVVGSFAKFLGGMGVALLTFTGIINAASSAFNSLVNILSQVGKAIYDALRPGIELYKLRETAQLSMAATLSNMAKEGGEPISYERGLEMSKDMINRMFMDAVRSAFNPEELIRAMQGTLGIALSKGFSLEQAYNVVKSTAAVGKAIQLPQNQLLQEVRDILQGTLTARSSQVAYAVGMTPDQLREAQSVSAKVGMTEEGIKAAEEQGKLYEYIMSKMQTYNVALERYADTFSGAMDRLTESWAVAGMQIFEQIAPGLNGVIDNFIKTFIGDIDANDNFQSVKTLQEVGKALDEIIFKLLADVDALLDLIKEVTGEEDNIGAIKVLIKDAIDLVALGLGALIVIVDGFKDAAILSYNTFVVLKNAVKVATGYIYGFIDALRALTVLDFEGMKNRLDALNKQYEGYRNKSWEEIVSEGMINPKDIKGGLGFGHFGKFYQSYGEGHAKYDKGQPKPYDPNNVVGDMVNAGKQNLADLRKAMQEAIERIKQELKEALAKLKDIAEQNELAYRQGYKSIEDYFSQKAQLEYQEAQLKVAALQREIEEVQKLDTGGDAGAQYQKERDLVRLNGELVIQQRESVKKEEQQTELLQHIYNHLANQTYKQGITAGTQISSGRSVASLSQIPEGVYYDVADADIEGLTDLTLQKLNAVAYEYFKEFGERIVVTSAKRYGDGSSWHDSGQAFDIAMDSLYDKSRRIWLEEIAEKYALVPLDEYPGEPGAIYAHGDNFHFSDRGDPLEEVMETVEQESEKAQNMLHGRMPQAFSTLAEAFEKAVEEGQNQMIAAQKQYASYMNKPYLYETISSAEVSVKYRKQIDTARARFGEMMSAIANYLELAFPVEQLKVESKALEQFVDNRLKMIEDDSLAMNKRLREKTMLFPQAIDTYLSYFSEKINDWAITDLLDKMAQKADELAKLGAVSEARDITKKIIEVRSKFISMIQSWIEEMNNYFNYRRELINADSGLTSFVKEERIKQLDKGEARVKAVAYAQEAVKLDELQTKYQEQLTKVIEGRNDELDKTMQTDTKLLEMSIAQLETEKQRAFRQAEINAKLGEQKTLWQETMDAANQALENGLYNFMTDYINTAESIGEAFRNMAIDILKDLQKFFAKKAITDLMHVITGTPNEQYNVPNHAETQTAVNTGQMIAWLQNIYRAVLALQTSQASSVFTNVGGTAMGTLFSSGTGGSNSIANRILNHATGGYISGKGTSTSDSIPAMLSNGEYVIKADSVRRYGLNFLDAVNSGHFTRMRTVIPRFADGGYVGDALQDTARGMTDFAKNIGTSVSTTNNMNVALVRNEQEAYEHFMRSPAGQRILVDFQKGNGRVFARFNS